MVVVVVVLVLVVVIIVDGSQRQHNQGQICSAKEPAYTLQQHCEQRALRNSKCGCSTTRVCFEVSERGGVGKIQSPVEGKGGERKKGHMRSGQVKQQPSAMDGKASLQTNSCTKRMKIESKLRDTWQMMMKTTQANSKTCVPRAVSRIFHAPFFKLRRDSRDMDIPEPGAWRDTLWDKRVICIIS